MMSQRRAIPKLDTDRGNDMRRELNKKMGISGQVTFPRYTGAPPPPRPADGTTNDPYADLLPQAR